MAGERSPLSGTDEDPWLTVPQVAELVGMKPVTVRRWIEIGELSAHRFGRRAWRVRRSEVDRYLRSHESGTGSRPEADAGDSSPPALPGERLIRPPGIGKGS